jgi:hypothetical protein
MTTLPLILKRKWFDMIVSGEKKEEYRGIKPYWIKRLIDINHPEEEKGGNKTIPEDIIFDLKNHPWQDVLKGYYSKFKEFDKVSARHGYSKNCPLVEWKHKGIRIGKPYAAWCEPQDADKDCFILEIGDLISYRDKSGITWFGDDIIKMLI